MGMYYVLIPWIAWGTFVMINNDEGDQFQPIFVQSTPLNDPLEWCSVHSAHARVGLRGSRVGPKVVQNFFFKIVPGPLGVLKQVV